MSSPKTLQLNWVTTADRGLGGVEELVDELVEVEVEDVDETWVDWGRGDNWLERSIIEVIVDVRVADLDMIGGINSCFFR